MSGAGTRNAFVDSLITLNAAGARAALCAAESHAAQHGHAVVIAVCDRVGNLLSFGRMDGASVVAIESAVRKARTAAQLRAPSQSFQDMAAGGLVGVIKLSGLLAAAGGIPIYCGDTVIGAVGVSGVAAEDDVAIAEVGARAVSS